LKRVLPDTNVLLSFLTDRNRVQQEECATLFEAASKQELQLLLHQNVLVEMVYVLQNIYELPPKFARDTLQSVVDLPGVEAIHELDWNQVLGFWPAVVPDFGDAILASVAKQKGLCVFTFDRKLRSRLQRLSIPCPKHWRQAE
jgi:predicted nucleic-acid-binding protein